MPVDQAAHACVERSSQLAAELAHGLGLVGGVLEHDAEGLVDGGLVEVLDLQGDERAGPVDRLGDRRRLLQVQVAQPADGRDELPGDAVVEVGNLSGDDGPLTLGGRVVEVQEQAAPLHRLGELARRVRGQHHERTAHGDDRAELGDRHLEVRQHLQQQALHLDVGLVDLVDQQHRGLVAPDGGQQRPREQELLGEDVVVRLLPGGPVSRALVRLDPEQLLLVVPLVQRPRLVQALVALQPHQVGARRPRHRLGQLGLPDTSGTLDEQRLLERTGEVGGRRRGGVGQVARLAQPSYGVVGRREPRIIGSPGRA